MKKLFLILVAAAVTSVLPAMASNGRAVKITPSDNIVTEHRTISTDFTHISVSSTVKLTVEDRTDNTVVIRANENILPYVQLNVVDGKLTAGMDKLIIKSAPRGLVIEIAVPNSGRISMVEASGATAVNIKPRIQASKFNAEVSGASKMQVDVTAEKCNVELSGATKMQLAFEGGAFNLEASGAANVTGTVAAVKSSFEGSGAVSVNVKGRSESAYVDMSGASNFYGYGFETSVCTVEVSGASNAEVLCTESLAAKASGVSKIAYEGDCRMSSLSTSGVSSIKKR